jgi:hypothetical protein
MGVERSGAGPGIRLCEKTNSSVCAVPRDLEPDRHERVKPIGVERE